MNLYMIHCGYYDKSVLGGVFEQHINFFVVAKDFDDAKKKAKEYQEVKDKKMHVDGIQEVKAVNGYNIQPVFNEELDGKSILESNRPEWKESLLA